MNPKALSITCVTPVCCLSYVSCFPPYLVPVCHCANIPQFFSGAFIKIFGLISTPVEVDDSSIKLIILINYIHFYRSMILRLQLQF